MYVYLKKFSLGEIWAYPTDTSFGLGVRADDKRGLEALAELKGRDSTKYFSLMVRDEDMLRHFAVVPEEITSEFFEEVPRTAILRPTLHLPLSKFWPQDKVAFRIATLPEVAREITFPVTATSANKSTEPPIFEAKIIREIFGKKVKIFPDCEHLMARPSSEIWDFTEQPPRRLR